MARTKETKMFPEQQEKMTQEVMASLHPVSYTHLYKDNNYEQKYIFNFALHQQTEGEGRRNSQHILPHHR